MTFMHPYLFWLMIIPFMIFAFLISTNKEKLSRIFDEKVLERLSAGHESMPVMLRNIIMFLAIFLMIVALARPVVEKADQTVDVKGLTLLTALDISGSMRSKDVYPNRLTFAKKKMNEFFDAMPSDDIGVVAFAHNPFVLAPFTSDKETLKMLVSGVDDSYINFGSTDFTALAELAGRLMKDKKPRILVLFTDGGDKKAIEGFSSVLKANDIDLYVVLVGTKKGAPVIDKKGKPMTLKDGTIAITQRNDALGILAKDNNGAYVVAANGDKDMQSLANVIHAKYKAQEQGQVKIKQRVEYFYYPLGLGLFLLLIGLSSLPRLQSSRKQEAGSMGGKI
ncbi:BatB [hydrothermal vent metagenome]|uniref:BatB n=1 Tax=hydrothermal vent metagenome TaxID=652676 RepID=A0A1W1BJT8_9ZZZZ